MTLINLQMPKWEATQLQLHFIAALQEPSLDTVYESYRDTGKYGRWEVHNLCDLVEYVELYLDEKKERGAYIAPKGQSKTKDTRNQS